MAKGAPTFLPMVRGSEGIWISPNSEDSDPVNDSFHQKPITVVGACLKGVAKQTKVLTLAYTHHNWWKVASTIVAFMFAVDLCMLIV